MASEIVKLILDEDGAAAPPLQKSPVVAMLLEGEAKDAKAEPSPLIPMLVSRAPLMPEEKQKGPVTVIMMTPYAASEMKGLVKALAEIDKKIGKVGKVYFEGSFVIGRKLPRLAKKYDFSICVRDHEKHLLAFKHLGGSGRHPDPMEEVRERLDDDDRLLRRDEEDAFHDMLEMATGTVVVVVMPGSSRIAFAEQLAVAHGLSIAQAPKQSDLTYADDIEAPQPPATLLVVTDETFSDVGAVIMARMHLTNLGRKVGKIIHTPSMAMEVIASLNDGTLFEELDVGALHSPFALFDGNPDYVLVAGNTQLGAAAVNIAAHRKPNIPCAELT